MKLYFSYKYLIYDINKYFGSDPTEGVGIIVITFLREILPINRISKYSV